METISKDVKEEILSCGYEILSRVGKGGMGTVYKVREVDGSKIFALKMAEKQLDKVKELRFWSEWDIGQSHNVKGVVRTFEAFESENYWCFLMDFIDGEPLTKRCGQVTLPEALLLLKPVAQSLDDLHDQNIVHRDLKPSNIMLKEEGESVLIDFGIHKNIHGHGTKTGQIMGTFPYMPPEQLDAKNVSKSADQYAFALTLFCTVYGRYPWGGEKSLNELLIIKTSKLEELIAENENMPEEVKPCFIRALHVNSEERYPSCVAFVDDISSRSRTKARAGFPFVKIALGVVALGLLLWMGTFLWTPPTPPPPSGDSLEPTENVGSERSNSTEKSERSTSGAIDELIKELPTKDLSIRIEAADNQPLSLRCGQQPKRQERVQNQKVLFSDVPVQECVLKTQSGAIEKIAADKISVSCLLSKAENKLLCQ